MNGILSSFLTQGWYFISANIWWMSWNLFLAVIPLALSFILFRKSYKINIFWWVNFLIFIAFLPNAPYILTDLIHLVNDVRNYYYSLWTLGFFILPIYGILIIVSFQCYVISLINVGYYLKEQNLSKYIWLTELILHILCAIGVYLGRIFRFNSWDLLIQPEKITQTLDEMVNKNSLLFIFLLSIVITLLYNILKQITLALDFYHKNHESFIE
jgi:uncharacterized membrane protein